ncbi:MAG: N-acetyl-gamma-glutamyl-phosphate reductase [Clostridia bacterium]|nr:N-acetyl-gamma-glutamyl-phosphate reductase [Clostridia bacterium]MBQ5772361.1 N-acetyl-gamma-glutamyl-phosphate reductase [Clostridia bacterium]
MAMAKVFIDGSAGTTGLRIRERLSERKEISLITLPEAVRKEPSARQKAIEEADVVFLCLPDDAAKESVALAENADAVIIDTSTAHRTAPGWVYGMPELCGQRERIRTSKRIANPGCHASGFVALIAPLVKEGFLSPDAALTCTSLTGYSGGGKKMIAEYEGDERDPLLDAPRMYGLSQQHKHLAEMQAVCGLSRPPIFCPIVAPFYSGMEVTVPLFSEQLSVSPKRIGELYADYYREGLIRFLPEAGEAGFLSAAALSGKDTMQITLAGNADRILLVARFDNLGKGASGAAIQNMNLILGLAEDSGLCL